MATRTWNTVLNMAGNTEFQAWAQGIIDTLKASNLVQTSDTGQLADPVVAARPSTATAAGYWIFRFNDTQQSNYPLYLKIEVGIGSSATLQSFWVTIGTGTDGAGTITGTRMARTQIVRSAGTAAAVYEHAASWGDGYFNLFCDVGDLQSAAVGFSIDRNRDTDGDPTDEAAWFLAHTGSSSIVWQTMPKPPTSVLSLTGTTGPPVLFGASSSNELTAYGGDVPVFPVEPFIGKRQPPLLGFVVVGASDVGSGVVLTTVMYGATYTFRRVSGTFAAYCRGGSSAATGQLPALAIRWE